MSCTQLYKKDKKQENERPIAVYLDIAIILVRTGSRATRTAVAKVRNNNNNDNCIVIWFS